MSLLFLFSIISCDKAASPLPDQPSEGIVDEEYPQESVDGSVGYVGSARSHTERIRDQQVINSLRSYYRSRHAFRDSMESNYGLPLWDVAMTDVESDDPYALLPFGFDGEESLSSILVGFYARRRSEWRFFIMTKDHVEHIDHARDIPKNDRGKREKFSKELYAGLFVMYEAHLFGQVDCDLLEILGYERSTSRDVVCAHSFYELEYCWDIYVGNVQEQEYQYTDCSYTYEYGMHCYTDDEIYLSPTEEDEMDDEGPSGNSPPSIPTSCGEHICVNLLDQRILCVYNQLTSSSLLKDVTRNFDGGTPVDLEWSEGSFGNETGPNTILGRTGYDPNTGVVEVTINKDLADWGALFTALTILHEGIHAEIKRLVYLQSQGIALYGGFSAVWDEFVHKYGGEDHELMMAKYVSVMGNSLYSFATRYYGDSQYAHNITRRNMELFAY